MRNIGLHTSVLRSIISYHGARILAPCLYIAHSTYRPTRAFYFVYDQHQICSMYGPILMLHFSYLCSGPSSLQKIRKNHVATTQNNNSLGNKFSKVALISQALNDNKTCPIFSLGILATARKT